MTTPRFHYDLPPGRMPDDFKVEIEDVRATIKRTKNVIAGFGLAGSISAGDTLKFIRDGKKFQSNAFMIGEETFICIKETK